MRRRLLLCLPPLLLGACQDAPPTAPPGRMIEARLASSLVSAPGFYFLPPLAVDPGAFTGTFDPDRQPTVRVVCTGAAGPSCPLVAAFGGTDETPISVDVEGESYGVVWHAPAALTVGPDLYRLEVRDGATLLGSAELWVVDGRSALKAVADGYAGVVRGSPLRVKFRIETADPDRPAVALVEVTPATSSVLAGAQVQLTAATADAAGNVLSDRVVEWSSSDETVATVSSTGLVTTVAPGAVTITATSEGQSATAAIESVNPSYIPAFRRPFDVDFEVRTTNYHDHDEPREFVDANGVYTSWWGESSLVGIDGHEGYDWQLPVGTPIYAVADGIVAVAGTNAGFFCPILGRDVTDQVFVRIDHELPGSVRVRSTYVHLTRRDVVAGQAVVAGEQIGISGVSGCALNPHLHFAVERLTQTNDGTPSPIDPYGWDGAVPDPWEASPDGAKSIRLWQPGEEPTLFRSGIAPFAETPGLFVQLTRVRFQGVRDELNPNNEYIEVSRDARATSSPIDLTGFKITTRAGLVYTFGPGTILSDALPTVRLYVGPGTSAPGVLYWGQPAGVLDNLVECVRLRNAANVFRNSIGWGGGCIAP